MKHPDNDPNVVEIRRQIIYKRFYNAPPYPEEVIRIDRSKINNKPSDIVYESYIDFGFKKELTRLYGVGFLLKRQLLDLDAHKAFATVKNLKLFSDIYMYKNLRECNAIFKLLEPRLKNKTSKDHFKELRISELADLI